MATETRRPLPEVSVVAQRIAERQLAYNLACAAFPGAFDGYGVERDRLAGELRESLAAVVVAIRDQVMADV
jgi:hypothetical protein